MFANLPILHWFENRATNRRGRYIKETASYAFQLEANLFCWPQPFGPSIRKYFSPCPYLG